MYQLCCFVSAESLVLILRQEARHLNISKFALQKQKSTSNFGDEHSSTVINTAVQVPLNFRVFLFLDNSCHSEFHDKKKENVLDLIAQ